MHVSVQEPQYLHQKVPLSANAILSDSRNKPEDSRADEFSINVIDITKANTVKIGIKNFFFICEKY